MRDEVRSAYAALGVEPGGSLQEVKRQFKVLVRTWHPDRFAGDPQGAVEANHRLRIINQAYNTIIAADFPPIAPVARPHHEPSPSHSGETPPSTRPVVERLTPEQIDAIVDALKAHEPRPSFGDQIRSEPWNRGLSLAVAVAYMFESVVAACQSPWPTVSAWHVTATLPATGPVLASIIVSALLVWPILYAIWYSDARTRIAGWIFLVLVAIVLPVFSVMTRM